MRNMREELNNIGERLIDEIGNRALKLGEQSTNTCILFGWFEPKIPIELLQEEIEE